MPKTPQSYTKKANQECRRQNYPSAIALYLRAITSDPNYFPAYEGLGSAYFAIGQYDLAIAAFKKALKIDSTPALAIPIYIALGNVYVAKEDYEYAINCYSQASSLDETNVQAYLCLANAYYMQSPIQAFNQACRLCQKVLRIDPKNVYAELQLGEMCFQQTFYETAVHHFKNAIEKMPECLDAHMGLGKSYKELDEVEKAKQCFVQILKANPECVDARMELSTLLRGENRFNMIKEGLEIDLQCAVKFKNSFEKNTKERILLFNVGWYLELAATSYAKQNYCVAIQNYNAILKFGFSNKELYTNLLKAYLGQYIQDEKESNCFIQCWGSLFDSSIQSEIKYIKRLLHILKNDQPVPFTHTEYSVFKRTEIFDVYQKMIRHFPELKIRVPQQETLIADYFIARSI